jgi:hypothetical protein
MAIIHICHHFPFQSPQKNIKIEIFGLKMYYLATLAKCFFLVKTISVVSAVWLDAIT